MKYKMYVVFVIGKNTRIICFVSLSPEDQQIYQMTSSVYVFFKTGNSFSV